MDEQKYIEEMASIIENIEMPEDQDIAPANRKEALIEAEILYNAGYRKVNDGDVVITKEQNEKWLEFLEGNLSKVRKETAKDIFQELYDKAIKSKNGMLTFRKIRDFAREHGVEVK